MEDELQMVQEKAKQMVKLLEDENFNKLIIEGFIKDGIYSNSINGDIDNPKVVDELKARQILHRYIFDIINYAETSNI
jgi:hypothetical protein